MCIILQPDPHRIGYKHKYVLNTYKWVLKSQSVNRNVMLEIKTVPFCINTYYRWRLDEFSRNAIMRLYELTITS